MVCRGAENLPSRWRLNEHEHATDRLFARARDEAETIPAMRADQRGVPGQDGIGGLASVYVGILRVHVRGNAGEGRTRAREQRDASPPLHQRPGTDTDTASIATGATRGLASTNREPAVTTHLPATVEATAWARSAKLVADAGSVKDSARDTSTP